MQSHATESLAAPTASQLLGTLGLACSPWNGSWVGVAVVIANNDNFAEGVHRGAAPSASVFAMKVLDRTGTGLTSNVIRALDFAVANRDSLWIDVINLSLGDPIIEPAASDPLVQAVERAVRAGIVVVVSAGDVVTA